MVRTLSSAVLVLALLAASTGRSDADSSASAPSGTWLGTSALGNRSPVALGVRFAGRRALAALGAGHVDAQNVSIKSAGGRIRFTLPGRPAPVAFDGRLRGAHLAGTTRQGSARGTFTLLRGNAAALLARGYFGEAATRRAVVDDPFGAARLVDLETGELHGLFGAGPTFAVGAGWSTQTPSVGTVRLDPAAATIAGAKLARRPVRQYEVRFASGGTTLAGTLTLPPGPGRRAAVAFVAGSGATLRAYLPDLQALLVDSGVAVLAYDKRGIAQSGGRYPGESPTDGAIDILAADAQAASRWLARQVDVDPARVGLAGHSQAGWIMPLAASREPAVRFLIAFAGPAVSADETDLFQDLTGQGERPSQLSDDEIEAEVAKRGPSGFDPIAAIRALRIPALWLYGGLDRHIPSRMSARRLEPIAAEPGRDFTVTTFAQANHALVQTQTGLTAEMLRSDRFAPGLFQAVRAWLRSHALGV